MENKMNKYAKSLVISPLVEVALQKTAASKFLYVARLLNKKGEPWCFKHPSGVQSSIVNVGNNRKQKSFIDRWLLRDKATHTHKLARFLKSYDFTIEVDCYCLGNNSDTNAIELALERCFMAACGCPPFFQDVGGRTKKGTANKETWLKRVAFKSAVESQDFQDIERVVKDHMDECGKSRWDLFKKTANEFFDICDRESVHSVGISFDTGVNKALPAFGNNVVTGVLGRLPTGRKTNGHKHASKVHCFTTLEKLARSLGLPVPTKLPVGQEGTGKGGTGSKHGDLERKKCKGSGDFVFRRGKASFCLDKDGKEI